MIDSDVDVARIARFCLGRFWASATPAQQAEYTTLFHQVLLNEISGHLGDYRGVSYVMNGDSTQGDDTPGRHRHHPAECADRKCEMGGR